MEAAGYVQITATVLQTLVIILGGIAVVIRTQAANNELREDVRAMQDELKGLSKVITKQAVQDERLNEQSRRMNMLEERVEAMRHGKGFVLEREANMPAEREY